MTSSCVYVDVCILKVGQAACNVDGYRMNVDLGAGRVFGRGRVVY